MRYTAGTRNLIGLALSFVLLIPLIANAQAPQAQNVAHRFVVPFRSARLLLIQATVAGHTGEFILDTGAEETLVDREFLGLKKDTGKLDDRVAVASHPADVRDFCIADHCFGKTRVRLMNFDKISAERGTPISGMIGQDLLQKFAKVTVDYKNRVIELES